MTIRKKGAATMAAIDTPRATLASSAVADRSGTFLSRFTGALKGWNDTRLTRKALYALTDRELDDIGLTRGEIEGVAAQRR